MGKAALLIDEPPTVEGHAPVCVDLPRGGIGAMVPVALPLGDVAFVESNGGVPIVLATPGVAIVPNAGEVDGVIELLLTDIAVDAVGEVDAVACPDDGEQLTLVPGVVGSSASGTGARVVFGVP